MNLKHSAIALSLATALSLAACGNEYGQEDQRNGTNNVRPIGYNQTSNDPMNDRTYNRNNEIDRDTRLDGNNQYRYERGMDNNNTARNMTDNQRFNNNAQNMTDNQRNNNNAQNGQGDYEYEMADRAREQIKKDIPQLNNVYVITTEDNAYVAASWDKDDDTTSNEEELSDNVRQKIVQSVKSVNNEIDDVYVSTNPDFFNLINRYSEDMEAGEPVEGFFDQMGNMIERVFPNNES
ncbi:sporulation lipoprotein, YhcN/YlaJ family [Gracilibacillus ureilyticus]|uniref:Sporulation lipoprotein, YhcN/YlaJ family n=1 Tax=Gracilibacillus ureilyticus TaxID=531814 RepID=A0A1H9SF57_9BACI|nr:YhcN/YlaJ family sporulation lipoprotein [Gracilibacillus ureilyticus]SER83601.1 sporulation lipoprotein, YhcN/YlaJ family [Gracilibacillus ureilyticus]